MKQNFKEEFSLDVNGVDYWLAVEGDKTLCELDGRTWYVDFTEVIISDEGGNTVTDSHPDFDDIMEELSNKDFEIEHSCGGYEDDYPEMF